MAYYNRKIIYMSLIQFDNKIKNAGFVKIEETEKECNLDIHISGVSKIAEGSYDILAKTFSEESHIIGRINIKQAIGEWKKILKKENTDDKEISYEHIKKIIINISENIRIEGVINGKEQIYTERKIEERKPELKAGSLEVQQEKTVVEAAEIKETINIEKMILNDKWKQLKQMYSVIHPYEDEREYISIQPKDFVIMTGDFQNLANNSFLLHGFYNYRYIILGKDGTKKEDIYYLGVPGVYYEREKMVALMFGFEAFECAGGIAEQGKFGYYLRKVTI